MKKNNDKLSVITARKRNMTFYKFLVVILISIIVPVLMMTTLISKVSNDHLLRQINRSRESLIAQKRMMVEQKVEELSAVVEGLVNNKEVWSLVINTDNYYNEVLQMRDVIGEISSTVGSNKMIDSIYLYSDQKDYVLSESKYSKDDFTDQAIFNMKFDGSEYISKPRMIGGVKSFSYIRRFVSIDNNSVYIAINLNYHQFWDSLFEASDDLQYFVFNDDYEVIYQDPLYKGLLGRDVLEQISSKRLDTFDIAEGNEQVYYWKSDSAKNKLTFVLSQKPENLFRASSVLRRIIVISFGIIVIISFLLAYFFSRYLYKPIQDLVANINSVVTLDTTEAKSEYQTIQWVITHLFSQNTKLNNEYESIMPYIKQQSVVSLLENEFDPDKYKQVLEMFGQSFSYPKYYLVLGLLENKTYSDHIKQVLRRVIESQEVDLIISHLDHRKFIMIINTTMGSAQMHEKIVENHSELSDKDIKITMSLTDEFRQLGLIKTYYKKAEDQLQYKFFAGENKVLFQKASKQNIKTIFYDKTIEKDLLEALQKQDQEKTQLALTQLTHQLKTNLKNIEHIKYIYFQVCLNVLEKTVSHGFHLEDIGISHDDVFVGVNQAKTIDEVHDFADEIIQTCMALFSNLKTNQNDVIIDKVKIYINDNYNQDLSLEDIAAHVYLSSGYLSSLFKTTTGVTTFEYLTNVRMDKAKELLLTTNIKIQDIAQKVGYNTAQSFIRYFKKYYSVTPNQFRRNNKN